MRRSRLIVFGRRLRVGANAAHGLRRSNADKRRAVTRLLDDAEWSAWSDREIARRCAVDGKTVAALRDRLSADIRSDPEPRTFSTKHGTIARMDTARIGRRQAEASPWLSNVTTPL